MPYKDPQAYREYMRRYRRKQHARKPAHKPEEPAPEPMEKADPEHVRRLAQAVGMAVATPRGKGILLQVSGEGAWVAVGSAASAFRLDQVGPW